MLQTWRRSVSLSLALSLPSTGPSRPALPAMSSEAAALPVGHASAAVRVAVRVRPFNAREVARGEQCCVTMSQDGTKTTIVDPCVFLSAPGADVDMSIFSRTFSFDHCHWSHDPASGHFAGQDTVYDDLGTDVLDNAWAGYNCSVFAYGQTGSGKSYTMMGSGSGADIATLLETQDWTQLGLIPRICSGLFERIDQSNAAAGEEAANGGGSGGGGGEDGGAQYKVEMSYVEIYNERVYDLLNPHNPPSSRGGGGQERRGRRGAPPPGPAHSRAPEDGGLRGGLVGAGGGQLHRH